MEILFLYYFLKKQLSYFLWCLVSILFTGICSMWSKFSLLKCMFFSFYIYLGFFFSVTVTLLHVHGHSLLHYSWQVVTYLAGCGLQSCPMLLAKGYPDIGWNPIEGERYLSFLRFAVFVNSESHVPPASQTQAKITMAIYTKRAPFTSSVIQ